MYNGYCPKCNEWNSDEYCDRCGTKTEQLKLPMGDCGHIIDNSSVEFCDKCGYKFTNIDRQIYANFYNKWGSIQSRGMGHCFIATATYGTPLHPQIDILRNYRDTVLNNNYWGKLFVKTYYKVSPPIADFIRPRNYLRKLFRIIIENIIKLIGG